LVLSSLFVAALAPARNVWVYGTLRFLQVLCVAPVFPLAVARIAQAGGGVALRGRESPRIRAAVLGPLLATPPPARAAPTGARPHRAGVVGADRAPRRPRPGRGGVRAARTRRRPAAGINAAGAPVSRPLVDIRLETLATRGGVPPGLTGISVYVRYGEFFTFL